ncbi:hypothetical protein LX36DRAFT_700227 [Colletotrichum falcatum]|nr:hypothetical protein LX36DRAFT_700227 [Colletotrichum falcatum]
MMPVPEDVTCQFERHELYWRKHKDQIAGLILGDDVLDLLNRQARPSDKEQLLQDFGDDECAPDAINDKRSAMKSLFKITLRFFRMSPREIISSKHCLKWDSTRNLTQEDISSPFCLSLKYLIVHPVFHKNVKLLLMAIQYAAIVIKGKNKKEYGGHSQEGQGNTQFMKNLEDDFAATRKDNTVRPITDASGRVTAYVIGKTDLTKMEKALNGPARTCFNITPCNV